MLLLGFSAVKAGLTLTPTSLALMLAAPLSGRLSDRIGPRWLVFSGLLVAGGAIFWLGFLSISTTAAALAWPLALGGLGIGLVMAPSANAVMSTAPAGEEGGASGIVSTMRQIGGVLGIAILGAILQAQMTNNLVGAIRSVKGLPPKIVERAVAQIESGKGNIMEGGKSMNMESLKKQVRPEDIEPIITQATKESVDELPAEVKKAIGPDGLRAFAFGKMINTPPGAAGAPGGAATSPQMIAQFQKKIEMKVKERMDRLGKEADIALPG